MKIKEKIQKSDKLGLAILGGIIILILMGTYLCFTASREQKVTLLNADNVPEQITFSKLAGILIANQQEIFNKEEVITVFDEENNPQKMSISQILRTIIANQQRIYQK